MFVLELAVHRRSSRIAAVACYPQHRYAEEVLTRCLRDVSAADLADAAPPLFRQRYVGPWQAAICAAMGSAHQAYRRYVQQTSPSSGSG